MKKEFFLRLILFIGICFLVYYLGIKPMLNNNYSPPRPDGSWAKGKLPNEKDKYDVVVVGGEPEGIATAVSAARLGAKTLLLCDNNELGGTVVRSFDVDPESNRGGRGEFLNKGIFYEIYANLHVDKYGTFTIGRFKEVINKLVKSEKNIEVIYNVDIDSPIMDGSTITGVNISTPEGKKTFLGKRIIDATWDGKLLIKCNVPFTVGSEDINLKKNFMPLRLNFEMKGVKWSAVKNKADIDKNPKFYSIVNKYEPVRSNVVVNNFWVSDQGDDRVIIQGIEVVKTDVSDSNTLKVAYKNAVDEAKDFANFLKIQFKPLFGGSEFVKAADEFYIREYRHFKGEHVLGVNEILDNKDFNDKIAVGSRPVDGSKLSDNNATYVIGRPIMYGVPLGCIVPLKVDNLLMVGRKVSYSSLASSSAGTIGVSVNTGESSGVVAVYSIVNDIKPRDMLNLKDIAKIKEFQGLLKKQGVNLPDIKAKNPNDENWAYSAVRKLNTLGLVAGGLTNNYRFTDEGKQEDLVMLLLNGVYRLSPEKYSWRFDARVRRYMVKDKITPQKVAEILLSFHGDKAVDYKTACDKDYINGVMQLKLEDKKVLTMDDVYYLAAYNIRMYAGKEIAD